MAAGFVACAAFGAILLMAEPALAGPRDATWNPPSRFDHPYAGHLTVERLPQRQVVEACARLFARYDVPARAAFNQHGCSAVTGPSSCMVITIDRTFMKATPQAVLRHEIGHCNGWPASHPN